MAYQSHLKAAEGRALFHTAWNKIDTLFFDRQRLRRVDWAFRKHEYDHLIEDCPSAVHYFSRMLSQLDEKFTRIVPQEEADSVAAGRSSSELYAYNNIFAEKIGYIGISCFDHSDIAEQVRERLEGIAHCQAFVVDLRGNGGGLINETVNTCELFIDQGQICSMETRTDEGLQKTSVAFEHDRYARTTFRPGSNKPEIDLFRRRRPMIAGKPMVILVDRQTCSSAELFCSALRGNSHSRGNIIVMGTRTGGKGIGQSNFDIMGRVTIKISYIRFFGPTGHWFGDASQTVDNGIMPDIILPGRVEPHFQVEEAVKYLLRYIGEDNWRSYQFRRRAA